MKVNSKNKGNRFEREICKVFKKWTGYEFSRVPASGGLRWKKADNITSDVICTDPKHAHRFQFSVECKNYKDLKFDHLLLEKKSCKIFQFWQQVTSDAKRANKLPMLIMKYNGMPKEEAFVVFHVDVGFLLLKEYSKQLKKPYMTIKIKSGLLYVFMLSDIVSNIDYKDMYKAIKHLNK